MFPDWPASTNKIFQHFTSLTSLFSFISKHFASIYLRAIRGITVSQDLQRVVMTRRLTRCMCDAEKSLSHKRSNSMALSVVPLSCAPLAPSFVRCESIFLADFFLLMLQTKLRKKDCS